MLTKMTAKYARDNFTDLLGAVYYRREPIAVEKKGRIFAVVINPQEYENFKKAAKDRFFEVAEDIQNSNRGLDADKAIKDVTKAVEEVRSSRYVQSE